MQTAETSSTTSDAPAAAARTAGAAPLRLRGTSIPALDGLRGIAIALVLLHHFTQLVPRDPDHARFFALGDAGWVGVDLFFVLSGFLITSILLETKDRPGYYASFFGRRFLRIAPLYYAFLVGIFYVAPLVHAPFDQPRPDDRLSYWFYLSNVEVWRNGFWGPRVVAHFWSLAIEEHFYLVWPFAVRALGRRALGTLCVVTWVAAAALRYRVFVTGGEVLGMYVLTPMRLDHLTMGGFLAVLAHGPKGLAPWTRPLALVCGGAGLLLAAHVASTGGFGWRIDTTWGRTGLFTVIGFFLVGVLTVAVRVAPESLLGRLLTLAPLRALGKYSYGIYVFHLAVDEVFLRGWPALGLPSLYPTTFAGVLVSIVARTAVTYAVAVVSFRVLEQPFVRLKARFA